MPEEKESFLDCRTKILLIVTISGLLIQCGLTPGMLIWNGVLLSVPILGYLSSGKWRKGLGYSCLYLIVLLLLAVLLPEMKGKGAIVLSAIAALVVKIMPGITFAFHTIGTIEASDLIAALTKMHMPSCLVWTISMVFRFFPTVKEEFLETMDGMRLRVHTVRYCIFHPIATVVDVFVPLIVSVVNIGDELLMATLTKGFSTDAERTSITDPKLKIQDYIAFILMGLAWLITYRLK